MGKNEKAQRYLSIAKAAISTYDLHDPLFEEDKIGHIGFSGYDMIKFRAESSGIPYLVNVHVTRKGRADTQRQFILSHLLWLDALSTETDLTVQTPVRNGNGDFLTDHVDKEDAFIITLLRWVQGDVLWDDEDTGIDLAPKTIFQLGEVLGKLHAHGSDWVRPSEFSRPESESQDLRIRRRQLLPAANDGRISSSDFRTIEQAIAKGLELIATVGRSVPTWGLLHGDFSGRNCVLYSDNVRPIDFDWCCYGYFAPDLGFSFLSSIDLGMSTSSREAYLEGYTSTRGADPVDLRLVETFYIEGWLRLFAWRVPNPKRGFDELPRFVLDACLPYAREEPFLLTLDGE